MFEIEKSYSFEAGHLLPHHDGKCAKPHGHSYTLKVAVRRDQLESAGPKSGMVIDFYDINKAVKPMLEEFFDHHWLNDTVKVENATAEVIAQWIFSYLEPKIKGLYRVTIFETATNSASYFK